MSNRDRFLTWAWIAVFVAVVYFYVQAHWTVKVALCFLFIYVSIASSGAFSFATESAEDLREEVAEELASLRQRLGDLEETIETLTPSSHVDGDSA